MTAQQRQLPRRLPDPFGITAAPPSPWGLLDPETRSHCSKTMVHLGNLQFFIRHATAAARDKRTRDKPAGKPCATHKAQPAEAHNYSSKRLG